MLYRPDVGVLADVIPLYHDGIFHLFYLHDLRDPARLGPGVPWRLLTTRDFVAFQDHGVVIPTGPAGSQDQWIFTGCAFEHQGKFHIFYTGHNRHLPPVGRACEAIMHAVSDDLRSWHKDDTFPPLFAPPGYERDDWRDPFVYQDADGGCWSMLLAARTRADPHSPQINGVTARLTSTDLIHWRPADPLYAPNLFFTHECPDLFRMGDWWYLIFSEFSDRHTTRYRMSRTMCGPWVAPPDDEFDTSAWYAAKTAGVGKDRYLFGWLATRDSERDTGNWQWGGDLVVHEIVQRSDGTLGARCPKSIKEAFGISCPLKPRPLLGPWTIREDTIVGGAHGASILSLGSLPTTSMMEVTILLGPQTREAGIAFKGDLADTGARYEFRLEPKRHRIVLDRRSGKSRHCPILSERACELPTHRPIHMRILFDESCVLLYVDNDIAMSGRAYEPFGSDAGLFTHDGVTTFSNLSASQR